MKLSDIKKTSTLKAPRIVLYGSAGIGKTTLGATFPDPIFVQTEDGLGKIEVDHFPLAKNYNDVIAALDALIKEDHEFKTVVVDSVDWLEMMINAHTCQTHGKRTIEEFGYGKGYVEALVFWREYIERLNTLRNSKGMIVCQLAHARQVEVKPPNMEPYHQWQIKLHKHANALVKEHCDLMGYCDSDTTIIKSESAGGKAFNKVRAEGRYIFCDKSPERDTKNRYGIETKVPMEWSALQTAIKGKKTEAKAKTKETENA